MVNAFRTVRGWHQPLALFALVMAGLAVVSAVGLVVDGRVINGAPGWARSRGPAGGWPPGGRAR